jgi:hypothetical protein
MIQIGFDLLFYVFESYDLTNPGVLSDEDAIKAFGKERFDRFNLLPDKLKNARNNGFSNLTLDEFELSDIMFLYYGNNIDNKSIEDIKKDFIIKQLLE